MGGCIGTTGGEWQEAHAEERLKEAHFSFALVSRQGSRDHEDYAKVSPVIHRHNNLTNALFTVLDGHGGATVARLAASELHERILAATDGSPATDMGEGLRRAYLETDTVCTNAHVGAVSCTALLTLDHLWIANIGDVRAVLCRGGKAEVLTLDHRAERPLERERIEKAGGRVQWAGGTPRVEGRLAVSRAFGDKSLKPLVIADPDVKCIELSEDCEFIIVASDGLWDAVSSTEAVRRVRSGLAAAQKSGALGPDEQLLSAARALASRARLGFSEDDVTVLIVDLKVHGATGRSRRESRLTAQGIAQAQAAAAAEGGQGAAPSSNISVDPIVWEADEGPSPPGSPGTPPPQTPPAPTPAGGAAAAAAAPTGASSAEIAALQAEAVSVQM